MDQQFLPHSTLHKNELEYLARKLWRPEWAREGDEVIVQWVAVTDPASPTHHTEQTLDDLLTSLPPGYRSRDLVSLSFNVIVNAEQGKQPYVAVINLSSEPTMQLRDERTGMPGGDFAKTREIFRYIEQRPFRKRRGFFVARDRTGWTDMLGVLSSHPLLSAGVGAVLGAIATAFLTN